MGGIIDPLFGSKLLGRETRKKRREKEKRRSGEVQLAEARRREQELRASGPQSSLRRVGLPTTTGGVGTSLLTQQTLAPPFAQRRN